MSDALQNPAVVWTVGKLLRLMFKLKIKPQEVT